MRTAGWGIVGLGAATVASVAIIVGIGGFGRPASLPPAVAEPPPPPPRFEEYPVSATFAGEPAPIDWSTNPPARAFKTAITRAQLSGPVFAGTYAHAAWGCGTECQGHAFINAETGAIVAFNFTSTHWVDLRLDSRLLVINPPTEIAQAPQGADAPPLFTYYYALEDGTFTFLERRAPDGTPAACEAMPVIGFDPLRGSEEAFASACEVPLGWSMRDVDASVVMGAVSSRACTGAFSDCPALAGYRGVSAVAYAENGTSEIARAPLTADGTFRLVLPAGTYVIDIAPSTGEAPPPRRVSLAPGSAVRVDFITD